MMNTDHILCITGVSGPVLRSLSPANVEGGDVVALSWSWDGSSGAEAEVLLGFLVEWKSQHQELGWQRVARERNTTLITGKYISQKHSHSSDRGFVYKLLLILTMHVMGQCSSSTTRGS